MGKSISLSDETVSFIREELLAWYHEQKRDLPWRREKDPYKIWVSEVMLQQTRVNAVIPYYERFIEKFPTLQSLADAKEEEVLKAWEGLGYYSRIRNLHSAVKEVSQKYGGKVPDDPEKMAKLKGIGPYTLGAVLSIAYDKKLPAVDGNVMRVFSRLFLLYDDISLVSTRKKMEQIALALIPDEAPGDFNQALMELGAMVCTPKSPQCLLCPVQSVCEAFRQGKEQDLPVKKKGKAPIVSEMIFLFITHRSRVLIEKRPNDGILAGMWGLPTIEKKTTDFKHFFEQGCLKLNRSLTIMREIGKFQHIFSHRHWNVEVYQAELKTKPDNIPDHWRWVDFSELKQYPFPNVYRKAFQLLEIDL
jgi:A/G-specific adenine glycosylase